MIDFLYLQVKEEGDKIIFGKPSKMGKPLSSNGECTSINYTQQINKVIISNPRIKYTNKYTTYFLALFLQKRLNRLQEIG